MKLRNTTLSKKNENENTFKCISCERSSCTVYIVLLLTFFTINISGIITYYAYSKWYLKKDSPYVNFNTYKETMNY